MRPSASDGALPRENMDFEVAALTSGLLLQARVKRQRLSPPLSLEISSWFCARDLRLLCHARPPRPHRPLAQVPSYPSEIAFDIIRSELGIADVSEVYGEITPEPVAAASLGQVYKARLRDGIPGGG